jgi:cobalt/nickel transport system permease protein
MTHMHIPDGILPVWLWLSGFVVMSLILGLILRRLRTTDMKRNIPLLGALSASMLVAMSIPILPGYHVNLSVVTGILIGPAFGFLSAFIVNLILAFVGHGGITVIGLNTLLLGLETALGRAFFDLFRRRMPVFLSAALATAAALCIVTVILIGFVALAHIDPGLLQHHHDDEHEHGEELPGSVSSFAVIALSIGLVGWIIEAFVTGAVVRFIARIKPALLERAAPGNRDDGPRAGTVPQ